MPATWKYLSAAGKVLLATGSGFISCRGSSAGNRVNLSAAETVLQQHICHVHRQFCRQQVQICRLQGQPTSNRNISVICSDSSASNRDISVSCSDSSAGSRFRFVSCKDSLPATGICQLHEYFCWQQGQIGQLEEQFCQQQEQTCQLQGQFDQKQG